MRSWSRRRLRTALTVFGIVLGVASILSINATNRSAYDSIERLFAGTAGRVSLEVRSTANAGGFAQDLLAVARDTEGVGQAAPVLRVPAALPGDTPTEIDLGFFGIGAGGLILHGIEPEVDRLVRDYHVTQGRFLAADEPDGREVVLVEDYASDNDLSVGDEVTLVTTQGPVTLEVVGLIAKTDAGLTNLGKFGVVHLGAAQELSDRPDELDQIDVVAAGGATPQALDDLRALLLERLGAGVAVVYPASQGERMVQMLSGYQIGLNFTAGIALFVGAFLIYNSFSMTIAERTREFGLLRAVGMTKGQLTRQVIAEGLMLGVIGAAAGTGLGIAMARGLVALMSELTGQPLEVGTVPLAVLLSSIAVGLVVTLFAALAPAVQAGGIAPLEALRARGRTDRGWLLRYGWLAGLALLVTAAAILVWNPFPYDVQFRLGSLTVFALYLGATLMIPVTIGAWQRLVRRPFRLAFGSVGEIGTRNLERAKSRTMLTCAALLVGVSMIVVISVMTSSFTADLYDWMDAYIGGDAFVSAPVPIDRGLQDDLGALPGVAAAAGLRYADVTWVRENGDAEEEVISLMAVDPVAYAQVTRFVFSGSEMDGAAIVADLAGGGKLLISSVIAEKYGLGVGDAVRLATRDGQRDFLVAGVVLDFFNQGLTVTGTLDDLDEHFGIKEVTTFLVKAADGAAVDDVIAEIMTAYGDEYQLVVESNAALKERALGLMDQAFVMFDVLGIIAVLVAALGIVNTLSMSVVERTREIGMLRSVGMTRAQVVRMVLAEAGLLGLIGGLLGLGVGVVLAWVLLAAMGAMSGYALDFVLPTRTLWWSLGVALLVSQLAALVPAVRAARTPVLQAIQVE